MAPTPSATESHQVPMDTSRTLYSDTLVTLIALICVLFLSTYLCALIVTYRYARNHPRALNKKSGVYLRRYAPAFYVFLVFSSLLESSLSGWLLVQNAYLENLPDSQSRISATLLLLVVPLRVSLSYHILRMLDIAYKRHIQHTLPTSQMDRTLRRLHWRPGALAPGDLDPVDLLC
ncbi:hypothetical protein C0995_002413 [Termitomyces sp. Mi166|nr:hypothetical protein C0995_002413 [Termitomyces sp. Mi166\